MMPDTATLPSDLLQYGVPGVSVQPQPQIGPARSVMVPSPAPQAPAQAPQAVSAAAPVPVSATPAPAAPSAPASSGGHPSPFAAWSTDQIADYLVKNPELALTPTQAKGAARWLHDRESGGDPNAYNPAGGGAGAYGLEQARGPRQAALLTLYGPTPTTEQQAAFIAHEFVTSEKPALQALKSATSEESAYQAMGKAFERPGGGGKPPAGEMQAGAAPDYQQFIKKSQEVQDRESAAAQKFMKEADKAPAGSQERHQAMQQAMEHADRLSREFEQMAAHPPTETPIDAIQNFGSLASVIGVLGGLFSRRPLTAALGAAGAAMRAKNENNDEQFKRAYKVWSDQTSLVSQALEFQNQEINQIMADERLSESERQDQMTNKFRAFGMEHQANTSALGDLVTVNQMMQTMQNMHNQLVLNQAKINHYAAQDDKLHAAGGASLNQYGNPPDKKSDNPEKPTPGSGIPAAVWAGASQYALTNKFPTLGNSAAGRAQIMSALPWVLAARGMTPADMTVQGISYAGALQGSKTLGARLANLNVGLSEVPHLGEQLLEVSDKTPRTESLDVNKLLQAYKLHTGDPQIVALGGAMNSYLQGYARAINPTGVISDDMRAHVDFVLNQAMSKGQIRAGVEQLNKELTAMQQGLQDAATRGKTMFPLPGEPRPDDPNAAPSPGSVPVPAPKYHAQGPGGVIYSDDGTAWYGPGGVPIAVH